MSEALAIKDPFGKATTGKLGMWLFIIMDGLSFGGLLIGGAALRATAPSWPNPGDLLNIPLTGFNTFLLICTSFTMVMALNSLEKGSQSGIKKISCPNFGRWIGISWGFRYMNIIYFILDGFIPSTSIYAAVFYSTNVFSWFTCSIWRYLYCLYSICGKSRTLYCSRY